MDTVAVTEYCNWGVYEKGTIDHVFCSFSSSSDSCLHVSLPRRTLTGGIKGGDESANVEEDGRQGDMNNDESNNVISDQANVDADEEKNDDNDENEIDGETEIKSESDQGKIDHLTSMFYELMQEVRDMREEIREEKKERRGEMASMKEEVREELANVNGEMREELRGWTGVINTKVDKMNESQGELNKKIESIEERLRKVEDEKKGKKTAKLDLNRLLLPQQVEEEMADNEGVEIVEWKNQLGVRTKQKIKAWKVVGRQEVSELSNQSLLKYRVQMPDDDDIRDGSGVGWVKFVNHSCDPNCALVMTDELTMSLTALRGIKQGEWLTVDYRMRATGPDTATRCLCGSKRCKGTIETLTNESSEMEQDEEDEEEELQQTVRMGGKKRVILDNDDDESGEVSNLVCDDEDGGEEEVRAWQEMEDLPMMKRAQRARERQLQAGTVGEEAEVMWKKGERESSASGARAQRRRVMVEPPVQQEVRGVLPDAHDRATKTDPVQRTQRFRE